MVIVVSIIYQVQPIIQCKAKTPKQETKKEHKFYTLEKISKSLNWIFCLEVNYLIIFIYFSANISSYK